MFGDLSNITIEADEMNILMDTQIVFISIPQKHQRIANSNALFPYFKSIHPNHSGQYLSRILKIRRQKTLNHAQI